MNKLGAFGALIAISSVLAGTASAQEAKDEYRDGETKEFVPFAVGDELGGSREATIFGGGGSHVVKGFQGISQYDVAAVSRNFIPPDTMGAVGKTQFMEFVNGGVAVFDKATGNNLSFQSDLSFWQGLGRAGANGDSRVMYNADADRWIALSFANSVSQIQIAVSDTSNALGTWKSTVFTGFAGGTADYPTLALDTNLAYIGTNNFNAAGQFQGTSLNVIPLASLFNATAPTTLGRAVVNTSCPPPYTAAVCHDGGFAIQGVNNMDADTTGRVLAVSLVTDDLIRYDINGANNLPTASLTPLKYLGVTGYDGNGPGRQPNAIADANPNADFASNDRVIDTLDDRVGSSVFQVNGRIYSVHTVTPSGSDYTVIRYNVIDAVTGEVLDDGEIGDGAHDYYQGSLAVNKFGQVVIGYNRSGSDADGVISVLAQAFSTSANGKLVRRGGEELLKVSLVDDYHNGTIDGQVAAGRQRWGDYSAVSLDPENDRQFWVIGEYAREYNNPAGGHIGTGGSRWSTWISQLDVGTGVPEPANWALMIAGFGMAGAAVRRRRARA